MVSDASPVLMNGDGMGSNWIWAFLLFALLGGSGFGLGGNRGYQSVATQDYVQNGFDNQNQMAQSRDILSAVTSGTAQTVQATNQAEYEQIAVAKDAQYQLQQGLNNLGMIAQQNQFNASQCCCNTLRAIDGVNYNNAQNTASINANTTAQTQKILDAISHNKIEALQSQVNQLQLQNAMNGVVRYPNGWTYNAGQSPFCGNSGSCCCA